MGVKTKAMKASAIVMVSSAALLLAVGCSALKSKQGPTTTSAASAAQPAQTKTMYLDFGDVLLPKELKVVRDDSFVFTTAGLTAGVLSLKGRVETNSLISFFENRMPEDGWQMISAIKAQRSMLLFKKQTRWCVVGIEEGQLNTFVDIWVAPTMSPTMSTEMGLTK